MLWKHVTVLLVAGAVALWSRGMAGSAPAPASSRDGQSTSDRASGAPSWETIRSERLRRFLQPAMEQSGIDAWLVLARENNNDPLAKFVGGEHAIGLGAYLFFLDRSGVSSVAIVPLGDSTPAKESGAFKEVITYTTEGVAGHLAELVRRYDPARIGVNMSGNPAMDGLSATQKAFVEEALGSRYAARLVSSEPLVIRFLGRKLPQEVEILREAARLTEQIQLEAYRRVRPGETTDRALAEWVRHRARELGLGFAWDEAQNPNVTSGPDRGHSPPADRVMRSGDIIQMDFGIRLHEHWVSDLQRFAYVLQPGATAPPPEVQRQWDTARDANRAALAAMRPGVPGIEIDRAQMSVGRGRGYIDPIWSTGHPVGYWAHDVGPSLGGSSRPSSRPGVHLRLEAGMVFSFDGFACVALETPENARKCISVEEMAVVTESGAEYLIPPQESLSLIPASRLPEAEAGR